MSKNIMRDGVDKGGRWYLIAVLIVIQVKLLIFTNFKSDHFDTNKLEIQIHAWIAFVAK